MSSDQITELFDKEGRSIGALLSAEAWDKLGSQIREALGEAVVAPIKEPLEDWETLKQFWDFQYPIDYDVECGTCGNKTADWTIDDPRKFHLTAANLAGLVSFKCQNCNSKIIKKHFKDEIVCETAPFQDTKNAHAEARYK